MAILSGKLEVLVYTDTQSTNNPKSKIMDIKETLSDDSIDQFQPLLIQIPNSVVDQDIDLNGIVTDKLLILSDQIISIKINGSTTPISTTILYIDGSSISSLSVSNSSGEVANVRLGMGK